MKTSDSDTVILNIVIQSHTACTQQIYETISFTTQTGTMLKVQYNDNLKPYTHTQSCNVNNG